MKASQDFLEVNGTTIRVRSWTSQSTQDGRGVLLIHGLGEHSGRYRHVARRFVEAGFPCFGFDLRGHGASKGLRGHADSIDQLHDDLAEIKSHFAKVCKRFVLYGHSLGGNLALHHFLKRDQDWDGVVLTSPFIDEVTPQPFVKLFAGRLLSKVLPKTSFDNGLLVDEISSNEEVVEAYRADPMVHSKVSAKLGMEILESARELRESGEILNGFKHPMLFLHGDQDKLTSHDATQELAGKISSCEFVTYANCKHELHHESVQEEMAAKVIGWIRNLDN